MTVRRFALAVIMGVLLAACGEDDRPFDPPKASSDQTSSDPFLRTETIEVDGIHYLCIISEKVYAGGLWCERGPTT